MRDAIAESVHSIFRHGLALRARLETGEFLQFEAEQATLEDMLAPLAAEEIYGAEPEGAFDFDFSEPDAEADADRLCQATIRYALICWLDELLLSNVHGKARWSAHTLESLLYGTNRRPHKFWEEAHYAEERGDLDALETFYWCVMLGFRGAWHDKPDRMAAWAARIVARLEPSTLPEKTVAPAPIEAPSISEAIPGHERSLRRMWFVALLTLSLLIPAALLLYLRHANA